MYFLILPDSSIGLERQRRGAGRQPGSSGVQPPQPAPVPAPTPGTRLPRPGSPRNARVSFSPGQDMRKHVIMTLLDTEQSYVESLRTLMQVRWHGRGVTPQTTARGHRGHPRADPWLWVLCQDLMAPAWVGVAGRMLGTAGAEGGAR